MSGKKDYTLNFKKGRYPILSGNRKEEGSLLQNDKDGRNESDAVQPPSGRRVALFRIHNPYESDWNKKNFSGRKSSLHGGRGKGKNPSTVRIPEGRGRGAIQTTGKKEFLTVKFGRHRYNA